MDGQVKYNSLEEAVKALVDQANRLDDPIDTYKTQQSQIGESGSAAWGGTAAEQIIPVLNAIKADIVELQNACNEFSEKVQVSMENYAAADTQGTQNIEGVKGV